jgi:hypothetical protein
MTQCVINFVNFVQITMYQLYSNNLLKGAAFYYLHGAKKYLAPSLVIG